MAGFLVGQSRIERALTRAMDAGRLAHGLLFAGPEGVGRERAARGLASGLLCEDRASSPERHPWGCGACRTCRRARAGNHPDVHILMSEAEAVRRGLQAPDKKRRPSLEILVDPVRELASRLRMAAYEGGARIAIILDAHRMNSSAQNALLKTLEEPSTSTWIILVVPHERMVLPTIASRCLRLAFAPLASADVAAVLRGLGTADAEARALRAEGSVARALALDIAAPDGPGVPLVRVLLGGTPAERLDMAEALGKERSDVDAALSDAARALAEEMRRAAGADGAGDWRRHRALIEAVQSARRAIAQNASVQLSLEALLLGQRVAGSPARSPS